MENGDRPERAGAKKTSAEAGFLLAQLGAHGAQKFAERLAGLDLVPAHARILRILAASPGMSQRALAEMLSTLPSRLVAFIDELEDKSLLERRPDENDRRNNALRLTEKGEVIFKAVGGVARAHQQALLAALSAEEQQQLAGLLQRVADEQGLIPGVHPGYRGGGRPSEKATR